MRVNAPVWGNRPRVIFGTNITVLNISVPGTNAMQKFRIYDHQRRRRLQYVLVDMLNKRANMALYSSPEYQTSFESTGLSVHEQFNIDFKDSGHLGFTIRMILVTFDLQAT